MPPKNSFVLDTSALLALRSDESGANRVEALLSRAKENQCQLLASFMSRMEVLYIIWRGEGEEAARHALRLIDSFPVQWVSCDPNILEIASRIKVQGGISVADSWIGATAIAYGAILVHKDQNLNPSKRLRKKF